MRSVRALVLALAGLCATGMTSAAATGASSVAPEASVEEAQRDRRRAWNDVHVPWLADLAAHLARSSNPRHLMVAARLSSPFWLQKDVDLSPRVQAMLDSRPKLDAGALVAEAQRVGDTDPLVWWIAANQCPARPKHCDRVEAVSHLQVLAPSNAAVWILTERGRDSTELEPADAKHDAQDDRHLERIADASRFDTYFGESLRSYIDAFAQLPPPPRPSTHETPYDAPPSDDVLRGELAFGYAMAEALPGLTYFSGLCNDETIERLGDDRRRRCLAALRNAARHADSVLVERMVTRALLRLLPEGSERDAVRRSSLRRAWQMASWMALSAPADPSAPIADTKLIEATLSLWRAPGATELGVMQQQLDAAGIPPDPPPDWTPLQPIDPHAAVVE